MDPTLFEPYFSDFNEVVAMREGRVLLSAQLLTCAYHARAESRERVLDKIAEEEIYHRSVGIFFLIFLIKLLRSFCRVSIQKQ